MSISIEIFIHYILLSLLFSSPHASKIFIIIIRYPFVYLISEKQYYFNVERQHKLIY